MKELIMEHSDLAVGTFVIGIILYMFLRMIVPGGEIYKAVAAFASGVC